MKRQAPIPTQKETMPPQMRGLLPHAAVRTTPDHDMPSNGLAETRFGHDFSQVAVRPSSPVVSQDYSNVSCPLFPQRCPFGGACHTCPPRVQAKLKVGRAGDKYEKEADRIADQVMRMPEPVIQQKSTRLFAGNPLCGYEEESIQAKPLSDKITTLVQRQVEEEEILQAKGKPGKNHEVIPDIESQIHSLRGKGQPLAETVRAFFEPRFGYNFSQVRVHTDAKAADTAQAINARAYTIGQDVVFGAAQYTIGTSDGRWLLSHELTHTLHQKNGVQGKSKHLKVNSKDKPAEIEVAQQNTSDQLQRALPPMSITPRIGITAPAATTGNPCPTSVSLDTNLQFNHSNLSASDQARYRTYLGALTRLNLLPGPDHTGHCMKEHLSVVSNNCPASVTSALNPCSAQICLPININGCDSPSRTCLTANPGSFLDIHRTRSRGSSLLEGTGVNSCSIVCAQKYYCDSYSGPPVVGLFHITRNYQASTFTPTGGTSVHITTGTVTKSQELTPYDKGDFPLRTLPEGKEYA